MILSISGHMGVGKDTVAQMIQYLTTDWKKQFSKNYSKQSADKMKVLSFEETMNAVDRTLDSNWQIKRFADTLKDITCMLIGCTREQLEDREFKEAPLGEEWDKYVIIPASTSEALVYYDREKAEKVAQTYGLKIGKDGEIRSSLIEKIQMTPRKLMQLLGTEAGREIIHPNIWVNALFADYKETIDMSPNPVRTVGINVQNKGYPNWIIPDTRFPNEAQAVRNRNGILIRVNRLTAKQIDEASTHFRDDVETINEHPSETALDDWDDWDYIIDNNGTLEDLLQKVKQICKKENIL